MTIDIRSFRPTDMQMCLALFASNTPHYFDPSEGADFEHYLTGKPDHYFVAEEDDRIVGCGGYYIDQDKKVAGMTWGMVLNSEQGRGIGKRLLTVRLRQIVHDHPDVAILLDTSQHTYRFYERFGFVVTSITPDGFGPGLDRYDMRMSPIRDQP